MNTANDLWELALSISVWVTRMTGSVTVHFMTGIQSLCLSERTRAWKCDLSQGQRAFRSSEPCLRHALVLVGKGIRQTEQISEQNYACMFYIEKKGKTKKITFCACYLLTQLVVSWYLALATDYTCHKSQLFNLCVLIGDSRMSMRKYNGEMQSWEVWFNSDSKKECFDEKAWIKKTWIKHINKNCREITGAEASGLITLNYLWFCSFTTHSSLPLICAFVWYS